MIVSSVDDKTLFYSSERNEWRQWLLDNFMSSEEIWFVFPTKASG